MINIDQDLAAADWPKTKHDISLSLPKGVNVDDVISPNLPVARQQVRKDAMTSADVPNTIDQGRGKKKRSRSQFSKSLKWVAVNKGGSGSGNFGHAGRPGDVGGSSIAGGGGDETAAFTGSNALTPKKFSNILDKLKEKGFTFDANMVSPEMQKNLKRYFDLAATTPTAPDPSKMCTSGKDWYQTARAQTMDRVASLGFTPSQSAGIVAACSPQMPWESNGKQLGNIDVAENIANMTATNPTMDINQTTADFLASNKGMTKIDPGSYEFNKLPADVAGRIAVAGACCLPESAEAGIKIARGEDVNTVLTGPKVRSFYSNIINPKNDKLATIDSHAAHAALGQDNGANKAWREDGIRSRPAGYAILLRNYQEAARNEGLLPSQAQAIIWLAEQKLNPPASMRGGK